MMAAVPISARLSAYIQIKSMIAAVIKIVWRMSVYILQAAVRRLWIRLLT